MEIAFATFQLRDLIESSKKLKNLYGDELANDLMSVFRDFDADEYLDEIIKFGYEALFIATDEILLKLRPNLSLQFKINDLINRTKSNVILDPSKIRHIKITGVNHEKP